MIHVWLHTVFHIPVFFSLFYFFRFLAHSPDNTFLGFVVGSRLPKNVTAPRKKKAALVYGKHYYMWKVL